MPTKRVVYILHSAGSQSRPYVGVTHDVRSRLADHNAGRCPHTARYRPWQIHVTIELPDQRRALGFERYLKSGSGRAFAKRHFG
jgi:putative endonuclease